MPLLYERIIDLLTTYSSSAQAGVLHTAKCVRTIFMAVITYGTLRILTSITHELRNGIFSKAGFRVGRTVTAECFSHLLSLEAAFHNSAQTGAVVRVVERGSRSVMVIFRGLLFAFFPSVLELALVCVVLFRRFSIWYAFITAVTFVLYLTWTLWINKELGDVRTQMNLVESEGSAKLTDSLMNIESVKSFHNGAFEYCRYDETLERYETGAIRSDWLYVALNVGQSSIFTIGMLVMFSQASLGVLDGSRTVASVVMLGAMMRQLWQPLNFLGWQYREVKQSLIDIQQLFEVMQRAPKIQDVTNAKALKVTGGEIVFDNVSFQYPEADDKLSFMRKPATGGAKEQGSENEDGGKKAALEGLSFKVPAGKSLAIVGPSGSGKSTTTRLLYRLYELSGGCISIDGQDISNATIASLRKAVSIVPQVGIFFSVTDVPGCQVAIAL